MSGIEEYRLKHKRYDAFYRGLSKQMFEEIDKKKEKRENSVFMNNGFGRLSDRAGYKVVGNAVVPLTKDELYK